jgi:hypothetical protein
LTGSTSPSRMGSTVWIISWRTPWRNLEDPPWRMGTEWRRCAWSHEWIWCKVKNAEKWKEEDEMTFNIYKSVRENSVHFGKCEKYRKSGEKWKYTWK